jgi:hypothetical protein
MTNRGRPDGDRAKRLDTHLKVVVVNNVALLTTVIHDGFGAHLMPRIEPQGTAIVRIGVQRRPPTWWGAGNSKSAEVGIPAEVLQ